MRVLPTQGITDNPPPQPPTAAMEITLEASDRQDGMESLQSNPGHNPKVDVVHISVKRSPNSVTKLIVGLNESYFYE